MADYISKFTGQEIDDSIQKAKDISKTANEINSNLAYTESLKTNLNTIADNEIVSKKSDGSLQGTGIVNEDNKIFFPKDGRFPSASIDVGPAVTISENGGWLQYTANTITHGLGYKFVQVTVADADGKRIDVEVDYVDENTLTLTANQNVTVYGVVSI